MLFLLDPTGCEGKRRHVRGPPDAIADHRRRPGGADRLRALLERWGHDVRVAGDARTAEVLARVWRPDLVLLELVLPDADGVSLIPRLRTGDEPPQVVIVSSHATVRVTVDALAAGAASVLEKPVDVQLLQDVLARLSCRRVTADAAVTEAATELGGMVTRDPRMRALFDMIRLAAPSGVNILVQGENGTGKELVAAALHALSPRAAGPFVKVNCAAIPAGLLESELFGHERGAFTGAVAGRKGLFEQSQPRLDPARRDRRDAAAAPGEAAAGAAGARDQAGRQHDAGQGRLPPDLRHQRRRDAGHRRADACARISTSG